MAVTATLIHKPTPVRPLRVLIVDDNEADVAAFSRMVQQQFGREAHVCDADTGASALDALHRGTFDVTLVDYRLPDMDGFQILKEIALGEIRTAAILLTGQGSESVAAEAIKQGARDYLVKRDVTGPALRGVIRQALESNRMEVQSAHSMRHLLRTHHEFNHVVKSLSHDMSANFMILENCIKQLRSSCGGQSLATLLEDVSQMEACLLESKLFLNDLATLAKTGEIDMSPARVEVARVVADVLFELKGMLEARRVAIEIDANLPVAYCNETRLRQVLSNLVRNAILHGCDAGRPQVEISRSQPRATLPGNFVWLEIRDNGGGIPAEYRDEIFQPGRRLPGAKSPGTGMGLAIVKQIVEYYGGTILVDPDRQNGTAFILAVPAATDESTSK